MPMHCLRRALAHILHYYGYMSACAVNSLKSHTGSAPVRAAFAGFTMIELVVVLLLVSVLAFFAIPRLNTTSMQVVPVAEQIAAELRYAQTLAMSRGEAHTFTISGNSYSISSSSGPVLLSDGRSAGIVDAAISADDASVTFAPRFGNPGGGISINMSGGGNSTVVVVEPETGYVRVVE